MRGSNASQKMSVAKHDRHVDADVDENMTSCKKNGENRRRQWQSGAAENRAAGLTARRCDVGLTSTWFEATLLDVNGLPDLPDISMNVTECHRGFLHVVSTLRCIYI